MLIRSCLFFPVMLEARTLPNPPPSGDEEAEEDARLRCKVLQERNLDLSRMVRDTEARLEKLQEGVVKLHEEYAAESAELREQVEGLTAAVEEEKLLRERSERGETKAERARLSLEAYLKTLPSGEELAELRRRYKVKEEEASELNVKVSALEIQGEHAEKEIEKLRQRLYEKENKVRLSIFFFDKKHSINIIPE